jgi:DNA-3-methyladenine glycosylase I
MAEEREYGAPEQITPTVLGDYLDVMSQSVFQSGMSWRVVKAKWSSTQEAFHNFDAVRVASMDGAELSARQKDTRVIRNARKLSAVVDNARTMIDLEEQHAGFKNYLQSHGGFEETVKDLRKRFKFLGNSGCFIFLYVVGEPVPSYEDWCKSRGREHHHSDH